MKVCCSHHPSSNPNPNIKEATGEATQKKALVAKVKALLIPQAGLLALPAPSVHVESSGVSATGDAPIEFHEYMYHNQGPSALDPRSGSIFFGGRSISSIYRRSRIDIAGPEIDEISSTYRRYIDDILTIYIVDILNVTFLCI